MTDILKKSSYSRKEYLHFGALVQINCGDIPYCLCADGFILKNITLKSRIKPNQIHEKYTRSSKMISKIDSDAK